MMLADQRGGVTAEFAITLPAVLLLLGFILGSLSIGANRISLVSAANEIARLEARGDHEQASARRSSIAFPFTESVAVNSGIYCVVLDARPGTGLLSQIGISARGCAAVSGRQ